VNKNIDHELPIKNLIVVYPSYLEVELTQGERTKQDLEIQNDVWCYNCSYAILRNIGSLQNVIMGYKPRQFREY